jgi:hypothetical protein
MKRAKTSKPAPVFDDFWLECSKPPKGLLKIELVPTRRRIYGDEILADHASTSESIKSIASAPTPAQSKPTPKPTSLDVVGQSLLSLWNDYGVEYVDLRKGRVKLVRNESEASHQLVPTSFNVDRDLCDAPEWHALSVMIEPVQARPVLKRGPLGKFKVRRRFTRATRPAYKLGSPVDGRRKSIMQMLDVLKVTPRADARRYVKTADSAELHEVYLSLCRAEHNLRLARKEKSR